MALTINRPGNSAAYCPMELRKTQCALVGLTAETIVHAVKMEIKLRIVKMALKQMTMPAQKLSDVIFSVTSASRISVGTELELNRTPSSVLSSNDINTILDE